MTIPGVDMVVALTMVALAMVAAIGTVAVRGRDNRRRVSYPKLWTSL